MRTYGELFRVPEFRAFMAITIAKVASHTIQNLALSSLVFAATGSAFLASIAFLAGVAPAVLGAMVFMSHADRVRPRGFLTGLALLTATSCVVLATVSMPPLAMIAVVVAVGLVASVGAGTTGALVRDVVGVDGYVLARSMLNIVVGTMQILGFAVGGALIVLLDPQAALLVAAAVSFSGAAICRLGLRDHPPRASGRGSVTLTMRGNRDLLAERGRRSVFLAQWIPNGLIVGAEALYVPFAGDLAGLLFCAGAAGMLLGDVVVGRFVRPGRRFRLVVPLRLLLALPYLVFWLDPGPVVAVIAVAVASVGFSASLALQERLLGLTPDELQGQAFGLASSGMVSAQALGALSIGVVAEVLTPGDAMTVAAVLSLLVTVALVPGLRVAGRQPPVSGAGRESAVPTPPAARPTPRGPA